MRRVGKWVGLVMTAAVVVLWLGSGAVSVGVWWQSGTREQMWQLARGRVGLIQNDFSPVSYPSGVTVRGPRWLGDYWLDWGIVKRFRVSGPGIKTVTTIVWLWPLVILLGVPTAWLWWRDARTDEPGCCPRCGYDLAGIEGACPECGTDTKGIPSKPTP